VLVLFICIVVAVSTFATAVHFEIIEVQQLSFLKQTVEEEQKTESEPIVTNTPPVSCFTYEHDSMNGYIVHFKDCSTDERKHILAYLWDFGDGHTSTWRNPVYTYDCSETNVFDITLTVSDGEFKDTYTDEILFSSHLDIIDCSQTWIRGHSDAGGTKWDGSITMTIENTGNLPAEIYKAELRSKQKENGSHIIRGSIYFSFTYVYESVVEGEEENGFSSGITVGYISNNTHRLLIGESVVLTSNISITDIFYRGEEPFVSGEYDVYIYVVELRDKEPWDEKWHGPHSTSIYLS